MSVSSTVSILRYTNVTPTDAYATFQFNQPGDLAVADGANLLVLNSDFTVTGGGYDSMNRLQTGTVTLTGTGSYSPTPGDTITIFRNISPVQSTTFASTGIQTPLMIEADDDKLTTLVQQLLNAYYNPFAPVYGSPLILPVPWITAQTGGIPTSIDSLNVVNIPTIKLPLVIQTLINYAGGGYASQLWMLRPMAMGDPVSSVPGAFVVPIVNPNNLIWQIVG
jgi:hypothetical protein